MKKFLRFPQYAKPQNGISPVDTGLMHDCLL